MLMALLSAAYCWPGVVSAGQAGAAETLPDDAALQASGARIGEISIRSLQIFDVDDPRENKALYRAANRLHVRTRESVIRAQLLFAAGDRFDPRVLKETERNLRTLPFLREPTVRATRVRDGVVDVEVLTHDVWTLQLGPSFGRSGGENHSSLSIEDQNLFGFGKTLIAGVDRNVDRDSATIEWRDPNVNGTHWQDQLVWTETSDGRVRRVNIWQPFYALSVRRSYGLLLSDSKLTDNRYALGDQFDSYSHGNRLMDVSTGWSRGLSNGHVQRVTAGWRVARDEFRAVPETRTVLPADRKFSFPYVRAEWIRDDFQTTRDLEQIERTEDVQFGLSGAALLGAISRAGGSDRNAVLLEASGGYGAQLGEHQQLFVTSTYTSRFQGGRSTDRRATLVTAWYWRHAPKLMSHARLRLARGSNLDLDHYYSLGGDNGLRGFPLRYQLGTGVTLLKLEERWFSGYSLWRLFDVGAAAFFDAGRVEGGNPLNAPNFGWLHDAGIGLRLGNSRSSLGNVIHIDLATPLGRQRSGVRSLQWLVSTEVSF